MDTHNDIPAWSIWSPGARVVVRRWLTSAEAEQSDHTVTDVIGLIVATGLTGISVRRDTRHSDPEAPPVWISADQIVAAKQIPPRRTR